MQNKGHYAVRGHSRSPILVEIDLLVVNSNLLPILHSLRYVENRYISLPHLRLIPPPDGGVPYIIS